MLFQWRENLCLIRWAFRSYKRLQILRFYWSNTGLDTGILHRRFTGAIRSTQAKFSWANPVALLLQEISLGSTGNLHRFWTRRVVPPPWNILPSRTVPAPGEKFRFARGRAPREPTRFVGGPAHPGDCGIAGPPASMAKRYRDKRENQPAITE